jgi:hypothetical protein
MRYVVHKNLTVIRTNHSTHSVKRLKACRMQFVQVYRIASESLTLSVDCQLSEDNAAFF